MVVACSIMSGVVDRCWFHRLANIRAKLPDESAGQVMAHLYAVRDAPTLDAARVAADRLTNVPAGVPGRGGLLRRRPRRAAGDLPGAGPAPHPGADDKPSRALVRRGTPAHQSDRRFNDERSAMKLVFATMIRAAERWCRVSISDIERHQLKLLRADLGLDPPPARTNGRKSNRRKSVAA